MELDNVVEETHISEEDMEDDDHLSVEKLDCDEHRLYSFRQLYNIFCSSAKNSFVNDNIVNLQKQVKELYN